MIFRCQHQSPKGQRCSRPTYANMPYCFWHLLSQRAIEYSRQWPFRWSADQVGLYFCFIAVASVGAIAMIVVMINQYSGVPNAEVPDWLNWGPMKFETQVLLLKYQMLPLMILTIPMLWAQGCMLRGSVRVVWARVYLGTLLIAIVGVPYYFWAPAIFGYANQIPVPVYSQTCLLVALSGYFAFIILGQVLNLVLIIPKPPFPHILMTGMFLVPVLDGLGIFLAIFVVGLWLDTQYHWIAAARRHLDI